MGKFDYAQAMEENNNELLGYYFSEYFTKVLQRRNALVKNNPALKNSREYENIQNVISVELSRFARKIKGKWSLDKPKNFDILPNPERRLLLERYFFLANRL